MYVCRTTASEVNQTNTFNKRRPRMVIALQGQNYYFAFVYNFHLKAFAFITNEA